MICCPHITEKWQLFEHNFVLEVNMLLLYVGNHVIYLFPDVLLEGAVHSYICSFSLQAPSWLLSEVSLDCVHRLLENWMPPLISSDFDISEFFQVFGASENIGRYSKDCFGIKY